MNEDELEGGVCGFCFSAYALLFLPIRLLFILFYAIVRLLWIPFEVAYLLVSNFKWVFILLVLWFSGALVQQNSNSIIAGLEYVNRCVLYEMWENFLEPLVAMINAVYNRVICWTNAATLMNRILNVNLIIRTLNQCDDVVDPFNFYTFIRNIAKIITDFISDSFSWLFPRDTVGALSSTFPAYTSFNAISLQLIPYTTRGLICLCDDLGVIFRWTGRILTSRELACIGHQLTNVFVGTYQALANFILDMVKMITNFVFGSLTAQNIISSLVNDTDGNNIVIPILSKVNVNERLIAAAVLSGEYLDNVFMITYCTFLAEIDALGDRSTIEPNYSSCIVNPTNKPRLFCIIGPIVAGYIRFMRHLTVLLWHTPQILYEITIQPAAGEPFYLIDDWFETNWDQLFDTVRIPLPLKDYTLTPNNPTVISGTGQSSIVWPNDHLYGEAILSNCSGTSNSRFDVGCAQCPEVGEKDGETCMCETGRYLDSLFAPILLIVVFEPTVCCLIPRLARVVVAILRYLVGGLIYFLDFNRFGPFLVDQNHYDIVFDELAGPPREIGGALICLRTIILGLFAPVHLSGSTRVKCIIDVVLKPIKFLIEVLRFVFIATIRLIVNFSGGPDVALGPGFERGFESYICLSNPITCIPLEDALLHLRIPRVHIVYDAFYEPTDISNFTEPAFLDCVCYILNFQLLVDFEIVSAGVLPDLCCTINFFGRFLVEIVKFITQGILAFTESLLDIFNGSNVTTAPFLVINWAACVESDTCNNFGDLLADVEDFLHCPCRTLDDIARITDSRIYCICESIDGFVKLVISAFRALVLSISALVDLFYCITNGWSSLGTHCNGDLHGRFTKVFVYLEDATDGAALIGGGIGCVFGLPWVGLGIDCLGQRYISPFDYPSCTDSLNYNATSLNNPCSMSDRFDRLFYYGLKAVLYPITFIYKRVENILDIAFTFAGDDSLPILKDSSISIMIETIFTDVCEILFGKTGKSLPAVISQTGNGDATYTYTIDIWRNIVEKKLYDFGEICTDSYLADTVFYGMLAEINRTHPAGGPQSLTFNEFDAKLGEFMVIYADDNVLWDDLLVTKDNNLGNGDFGGNFQCDCPLPSDDYMRWYYVLNYQYQNPPYFEPEKMTVIDGDVITYYTYVLMQLMFARLGIDPNGCIDDGSTCTATDRRIFYYNMYYLNRTLLPIPPCKDNGGATTFYFHYIGDYTHDYNYTVINEDTTGLLQALAITVNCLIGGNPQSTCRGVPSSVSKGSPAIYAIGTGCFADNILIAVEKLRDACIVIVKFITSGVAVIESLFLNPATLRNSIITFIQTFFQLIYVLVQSVELITTLIIETIIEVTRFVLGDAFAEMVRFFLTIIVGIINVFVSIITFFVNLFDWKRDYMGDWSPDYNFSGYPTTLQEAHERGLHTFIYKSKVLNQTIDDAYGRIKESHGLFTSYWLLFTNSTEKNNDVHFKRDGSTQSASYTWDENKDFLFEQDVGDNSNKREAKTWQRINLNDFNTAHIDTMTGNTMCKKIMTNLNELERFDEMDLAQEVMWKGCFLLYTLPNEIYAYSDGMLALPPDTFYNPITFLGILKNLIRVWMGYMDYRNENAVVGNGQGGTSTELYTVPDEIMQYAQYQGLIQDVLYGNIDDSTTTTTATQADLSGQVPLPTRINTADGSGVLVMDLVTDISTIKRLYPNTRLNTQHVNNPGKTHKFVFNASLNSANAKLYFDTVHLMTRPDSIEQSTMSQRCVINQAVSSDQPVKVCSSDKMDTLIPGFIIRVPYPQIQNLAHRDTFINQLVLKYPHKYSWLTPLSDSFTNNHSYSNDYNNSYAKKRGLIDSLTGLNVNEDFLYNQHRYDHQSSPHYDPFVGTDIRIYNSMAGHLVLNMSKLNFLLPVIDGKVAIIHINSSFTNYLQRHGLNSNVNRAFLSRYESYEQTSIDETFLKVTTKMQYISSRLSIDDSDAAAVREFQDIFNDPLNNVDTDYYQGSDAAAQKRQNGETPINSGSYQKTEEPTSSEHSNSAYTGNTANWLQRIKYILFGQSANTHTTQSPKSIYNVKGHIEYMGQHLFQFINNVQDPTVSFEILTIRPNVELVWDELVTNYNSEHLKRETQSDGTASSQTCILEALFMKNNHSSTHNKVKHTMMDQHLKRLLEQYKFMRQQCFYQNIIRLTDIKHIDEVGSEKRRSSVPNAETTTTPHNNNDTPPSDSISRLLTRFIYEDVPGIVHHLTKTVVSYLMKPRQSDNTTLFAKHSPPTLQTVIWQHRNHLDNTKLSLTVVPTNEAWTWKCGHTSNTTSVCQVIDDYNNTYDETDQVYVFYSYFDEPKMFDQITLLRNPLDENYSFSNLFASSPIPGIKMPNLYQHHSLQDQHYFQEIDIFKQYVDAENAKLIAWLKKRTDQPNIAQQDFEQYLYQSHLDNMVKFIGKANYYQYYYKNRVENKCLNNMVWMTYYTYSEGENSVVSITQTEYDAIINNYKLMHALNVTLAGPIPLAMQKCYKKKTEPSFLSNLFKPHMVGWTSIKNKIVDDLSRKLDWSRITSKVKEIHITPHIQKYHDTIHVHKRKPTLSGLFNIYEVIRSHIHGIDSQNYKIPSEWLIQLGHPVTFLDHDRKAYPPNEQLLMRNSYFNQSGQKRSHFPPLIDICLKTNGQSQNKCSKCRGCTVQGCSQCSTCFNCSESNTPGYHNCLECGACRLGPTHHCSGGCYDCTGCDEETLCLNCGLVQELLSGIIDLVYFCVDTEINNNISVILPAAPGAHPYGYVSYLNTTSDPNFSDYGYSNLLDFIFDWVWHKINSLVEVDISATFNLFITNYELDPFEGPVGILYFFYYSIPWPLVSRCNRDLHLMCTFGIGLEKALIVTSIGFVVLLVLIFLNFGVLGMGFGFTGITPLYILATVSLAWHWNPACLFEPVFNITSWLGIFPLMLSAFPDCAMDEIHTLLLRIIQPCLSFIPTELTVDGLTCPGNCDTLLNLIDCSSYGFDGVVSLLVYVMDRFVPNNLTFTYIARTCLVLGGCPFGLSWAEGILSPFYELKFNVTDPILVNTLDVCFYTNVWSLWTIVPYIILALIALYVIWRLLEISLTVIIAMWALFPFDSLFRAALIPQTM